MATPKTNIKISVPLQLMISYWKWNLNLHFFISVPGKLKQFIDDLHSGKLHQDFHNPPPDDQAQAQGHHHGAPQQQPDQGGEQAQPDQGQPDQGQPDQGQPQEKVLETCI